MKYTLLCDDNFHYMEESEREVIGDFESAEAAIAAAKGIVDRDLLKFHRSGMDAGQLYAHYQSFGLDPFIRSDDRSCVFSAWTYAETRCREICAGRSVPGDL